jgi:antitoxin (DNA-binding transcriptional repressor) of toxin-antitoxin stability system
MQVSMREFKTHLSQYVWQAQSGQSIELTSYRKVVARLVGVSANESAGMARLVAADKGGWQGGKPVGADLKLKPGGKSLSAMVLEDRG